MEIRRDMWQTMVASLFNAALALLYFELSESQKKTLKDSEDVLSNSF